MNELEELKQMGKQVMILLKCPECGFEFDETLEVCNSIGKSFGHFMCRAPSHKFEFRCLGEIIVDQENYHKNKSKQSITRNMGIFGIIEQCRVDAGCEPLDPLKHFSKKNFKYHIKSIEREIKYLKSKIQELGILKENYEDSLES